MRSLNRKTVTRYRELETSEISSTPSTWRKELWSPVFHGRLIMECWLICPLGLICSIYSLFPCKHFECSFINIDRSGFIIKSHFELTIYKNQPSSSFKRMSVRQNVSSGHWKRSGFKSKSGVLFAYSWCRRSETPNETRRCHTPHSIVDNIWWPFPFLSYDCSYFLGKNPRKPEGKFCIFLRETLSDVKSWRMLVVHDSRKQKSYRLNRPLT